MVTKYTFLFIVIVVQLIFAIYYFSPFEQGIRNININHKWKILTNPVINNETSDAFLTKYRINTKGCNITNQPIFDEETIKIFKNDSVLIWKCDKNKIDILRFNETWLKIDYHGLTAKCYYRDLKRGSDDFNMIYGNFQGPIKENIINMGRLEFVHLACYDKRANETLIMNEEFDSKLKELIHHQIIPMIPEKPKIVNSTVPNILLLAVDSTSYLNFRRHFIRTEKLIKNYKFIELKGYNKVGANTFPNMIPMLTGFHFNDLVSNDNLSKIQFDDWPIIWKDFSKEGFVTVFVEEMPAYGLFHYGLKGFKNKPVDYQTRPYHLEVHKDHYNDYCYKDRSELEHSLDYTYDMMKAMKKREQKYFAYISMCELSHHDPNTHHYMDVPYHNFFKNIFDDNLVEDTIIFFFSDHGLRFGKLRETHSGEMENRLPFSYTYFPKNTKSEFVENFKKNQDRLTTHFDIHATMSHLIHGKPAHDLKYGLSLIDQIVPENRTCKDAGIPEMFCACHEDIEVKFNQLPTISKTIPDLISKLNNFTSSTRDLCEKFEFDKFKSIYNRTISTADGEYLLGDSHFYITQFYVKPGGGLFETTLRSYKSDSKFEIIGEMTRINRYDNQSHCVNIKILKNYCFCKDLL